VGGENQTAKLPRWARREARNQKRRGQEFDSRQLGMIAQWPEQWGDYHTHGLESLVMSGRVDRTLFTEPLGRSADRVLAMFIARDSEAPWIYFVAGRLLAGVGAEILLKGLYLKRGYSIRNPEDPQRQPVARLGTPEALLFDPYVCASFGTLLAEHNLELLGDARVYKPLTVAKWWRDQAAHTAMSSTGDAGVHLIRLAMSLRVLHDELSRDADASHVAKVEALLRERRPIGPVQT
jgi:hypothetical protein